MPAPQSGNRRERRNLATAIAKEFMRDGSHRKRSFDVALWCLAAVMAVVLLLIAPRISRGVTLALLLVTVGLLVQPVRNLPWNRDGEGKTKLFKLALTMCAVIIIVVAFGIFVMPPKPGAVFSVTQIAWDAHLINLGKGPCAGVMRRTLTDGTCQGILPPGFANTPLHAEVKMNNSGDSKAEDVYWHGGAIAVANDLNETQEDVLFTQTTAQQITNWPEFKVGETRSLTIRNENPALLNADRVIYLMLRGSFHDDLGKRPDVELCKRYGRNRGSLFDVYHFDEFCKGHNLGINHY